MTGEISLTGKVLRWVESGRRSWVARRAGIKHVILPAACERTTREIPEYLKTDLEVHYADNYDKVFEAAFNSSCLS
jgi:ATP-dependent Lon protease